MNPTPYLSELKTLEKKKRELLLLQFLILGLLTGAVIVLSLLEQKFLTLFFLGLLSTLFCLYILEKERNLKTLNHHLVEEQIRNIEEKFRTAALQDKLSEMKVLYKAGRIAVSSMGVEKKLNKIFRIALRLVRADRGSIMLVDDTLKQFVFAVTHGLDPDLIRQVRQQMKEGVAGWVTENRAPLLLHGQPGRDPRFSNFVEKNDEIESSLSLPLKIRGKVVGTLNLSYLAGSKKLFTDYDLRRLSVFAHFLGVALQQNTVSRLTGPSVR